MKQINLFDVSPGGIAGQPPTAPLGGGYTPTRGRGLPSKLEFQVVQV